MNAQRLRPLGLGDIFDEGFDLYKRNFVFLLLVTAITVVPLDIGLTYAGPGFFSALFDLLGITAGSDGFLIWLVVSGAKLLLFGPLFLLAVGPLAAASAGRYLGKDGGVWPVYRLWLRRLPVLLPTLLLVGLAMAIGLAFCGVGWLLPALQFSFVLQGVLVEGQGWKAIGRSSELLGGYGGRVFSCLLMLALVAWVISLGITFPLAYLVGNVLHLAPGVQSLYGGAAGGPTAEQQAVQLISSGLAHLAVIPFLVCVVTVLFYDLRVRKEGFDIELLAEGLRFPPLSAFGPHLPPAAVYGPIRPGMPPRPQPAPGPGGRRR